MVRRGLRPDVIDLVARAAFVAVVVLALFVLVGILSGNAGVAASGLAVALILAGLGVQDILRNYVSGVYLLTERRFAVGDEIEIGGQYSGKIVEIKLRVTYLRASKGKLIIVPNAELFNQIISVHSTET
jgi:small-conductance mechanosensitive channel